MRLWAIMAVLLLGQSLAAQTYVDDRSSPEAVITSLYNALNNRDFARAWSYFDPAHAPSFSAYIRGFDDTRSITARVEPAILREAGLWHVPVVLEAAQRDGSIRVFAGCYLVGQDPTRQRPPYAPIAIQSGHFHLVEGPGTSVSGECAWADG